MEEKQTQQRAYFPLANFGKVSKKNLPPDAFIVREAESRAAELMRQKGVFFPAVPNSRPNKKFSGKKNANEQSCKFGKLQVKF